LAHDAQLDGPHENGDRMAEASYFLALHLRRLAQEITDLAYPDGENQGDDGPLFTVSQSSRHRRRWQPRTGQAAASEKTMAKSRLREVFLAWKAFQDAGEDDDSPIGKPLRERAHAAEMKIREWISDGPAVLIAKLIASKTGEIHRDIGSPSDEAMAADAALNGLRWFGLEKLYNECWPVDASQSKKASRDAEAAS
jgi:hypothetical protein